MEEAVKLKVGDQVLIDRPGVLDTKDTPARRGTVARLPLEKPGSPPRLDDECFMIRVPGEPGTNYYGSALPNRLWPVRAEHLKPA